MKKVFLLGMLTGAVLAVALAGGGDFSGAVDTAPATSPKPESPASDGWRLQTGVVADGEQVPVPAEADTASVQIFLSIREIQDNNELLGRVECRLEDDGRTARVRNVNTFTGEVVARGTANYLLFLNRD